MQPTTPAQITRFFHDEEGATAIEYGLIVSLTTLVLLGALQVFSAAMDAKYDSVSTAVNTVTGG